MSLWAKLHCDILGDPKLIRGAREGHKELVLLPWLIAYAKRADDDGRLTVDGRPAEPVDIARDVPGVRKSRVKTALSSLETLGILARDDKNALQFIAWDVRSGEKSSDSKAQRAARQQRHRDRKRLQRNAEATNSTTTPVTPSNALRDVTRNATEREVELEQERERERESVTPPPPAPPVSHAGAAQLPTAAQQLVADSPITRRAPIAAEMADVLGQGLVHKGGIIRATTDRLDAKCRETLDQHRRDPVRNLWAYTLAKLGDVSDDSPTERAATQARRDEQDSATDVAAAMKWYQTVPYPEQQRIEAQLPGPESVGYSVLRIAAIRSAYHAAKGIAA